MTKMYSDDDFCDIYSKKICDNCGKCLEESGVDIRAINIEDISKSVEQNEVIEKELQEALAALKREQESEKEEVIENESIENFLEDSINEDDYVDAFDNVVYFDELGLEEDSLEDMTEEVYPGIRKIKHK